MLNSPKYKPLAIFKPSRSQSSLRSSNAGEAKRNSSYLESPLESPINSPDPSHHPLERSTSNDFFGTPEPARGDDSPTSTAAESPRTRQQPQSVAHRSIQRSQSTRSSPSRYTASSSTVGSVAPRAGQSPGLESPDESGNNSWLNDKGSQPEPKKKRGFFRGLSDLRHSKDSSATTQKAPRRTLIKNPKGPQAQVVAQNPRQSQQSPYPSALSSTREEESEEEIVTKNLYRHSVAIPATSSGYNNRSPSPEDFYSSTSTTTNREPSTSGPTAPPNTASGRPPSAEQGSAHKGAWERIGRVVPHHQRASSSNEVHQLQQQQSQPQQQQSLHPITSSGTTALASLHRGRLDPNYPESSNSRPPSRQSIESPSPLNPQGHGQIVHRPSSGHNSLQETPMVAPGGQQHSGRGNMDNGQQNAQAGSNRGERQYGSTLSVNSQQTSNFPTSPGASSMQGENNSTAERKATPPPARSRDDLSNLEVPALISRFEELNEKYRKVKKYYFDKDAQVTQLQNTLAVQRLAQSRTSLDDNEYATRFSRLDGAINNLAFNIRKDWRAVPPWLAQYVNKDATTTVTKEMTAVGRACISRWLVDELFDRYFHPGLEPTLSGWLKIVEKNLRRFAPPTPTEEEREALLAKISNWRLATLDGLQDMLNTHDAVENRAALTKMLVEMLTQDLTLNLKDPSPVGLEAGVVGIIELAVGVAANLPLESRDVYVDYIMPGTPVNEAFMKVEGPLPALTNPGEGHPGGAAAAAAAAGAVEAPDTASVGSGDEKDDEEVAGGKDAGAPAQGKKKGMFTGLISGSKKNSQASRGNAPEQPQPPKEDRVRFAAFMSVEVRGKAMLIKAPVYV